MKEIKDAEDRIQSEGYIWFHNTYPQFRGLLCYNLNNSKNAIDGNKNKGLGLQKGRSDLVLYWNGKAYMLECKTPKGRQSTGQVVWQETVEKQGFEYHVFRSKEELIKIITLIIGYY
tara:strand:- start:688 stop:1038 length:351 start_codon:yes stop_codon:yes gene_type:complete